MPRPDTASLVTDSLTETAYAKINLALHVRGRRADGYHALESLFVFAEDGDVLTAQAVEGDALTLTIDGPFAAGLACDEGNLVLRAARLLRERAGYTQGAALHLRKTLPVASGIGGGSADAAAALRLLSRLWRLDVPAADLHEVALAIGSDVPACLVSRTLFVGGRGEVLDQREIADLAGMPMLLVNPGVPVSTGPVFAGWDQVDRGPLDAGTLDALIERGRNDLEAPAIAIAPIVDDVMTALAGQQGVRLARMSGSGATCFALFDRVEDRRTAAAMIGAIRPDWWSLETNIRETGMRDTGISDV